MKNFSKKYILISLILHFSLLGRININIPKVKINKIKTNPLKLLIIQNQKTINTSNFKKKSKSINTKNSIVKKSVKKNQIIKTEKNQKSLIKTIVKTTSNQDSNISKRKIKKLKKKSKLLKIDSQINKKDNQIKKNILKKKDIKSKNINTKIKETVKRPYPKWLKKYNQGNLKKLNLNIKSKNIYTKSKWQKFNLKAFQSSNDKEIQSQTITNANAINYIQKILNQIGNIWFKKYAPFNQIINGIIKDKEKIIVKIKIDKNQINQIKFIQKSINQIENKGVKYSLNKVILPKNTHNINYRNLKLTFIIKKTKQPNKFLAIAKVKIEGEYKQG